jgi:flagellar biosynthesis/type III secretory pathway M-ring protein FliF/YscJ
MKFILFGVLLTVVLVLGLAARPVNAQRRLNGGGKVSVSSTEEIVSVKEEQTNQVVQEFVISTPTPTHHRRHHRNDEEHDDREGWSIFTWIVIAVIIVLILGIVIWAIWMMVADSRARSKTARRRRTEAEAEPMAAPMESSPSAGLLVGSATRVDGHRANRVAVL